MSDENTMTVTLTFVDGTEMVVNDVNQNTSLDDLLKDPRMVGTSAEQRAFMEYLYDKTECVIEFHMDMSDDGSYYKLVMSDDAEFNRAAVNWATASGFAIRLDDKIAMTRKGSMRWETYIEKRNQRLAERPPYFDSPQQIALAYFHNIMGITDKPRNLAPVRRLERELILSWTCDDEEDDPGIYDDLQVVELWCANWFQEIYNDPAYVWVVTSKDGYRLADQDEVRAAGMTAERFPE